jgi:hypothetical protein
MFGVSKFTKRLWAILPFAAAWLLAASAPAMMAQSAPDGFLYNGFNLASYSQTEYLTMGTENTAANIRSTGANYTAVIATQYVQTETSNSIAASSNTPNDEAVAYAIQALQAQGITVTMKPVVDSLDGNWRGNFTWPSTDTTMAEQQAWLDAWFASYKTFILHYAQIAVDNNVGILVFGSEFAKLTGTTQCAGSSCESYWLKYVINPLRAQYPSLMLVYGANATATSGDEYQRVSFWDDIDAIGVDVYFPLNATTNPDDPSVADLVSAWTNNPGASGFNAVKALQAVQQAHSSKPMIFTEVGYESVTGTNTDPSNYSLSGIVDDSDQANCYQAFFEVWPQYASWMEGAFWWDWSVSAPTVSTDTGYSPQGKSAEQWLDQYFGSASGTTSGFTLAVSNSLLPVGQGLSATDTIAITPMGAFSGTVTLTATGLPSGVTGVFTSGTAANTQVLTLTAGGTATTGTATVTITGTSGSLSATTSITLTVQAPVSQIITFANPGSQTAGGALILSATASSGLPVSFASTTTSICTVNNTTGMASFLTAGTCSITASQAGNGIYSAAPTVSQSFTVNAELGIAASADVVVSQVNWLASLASTSASSAPLQGGFGSTVAPEGGGFAVNSKGDIFIGDQWGYQTFWINGTTNAVTVLVNDLSNSTSWNQMSGPVTVDKDDNIYVAGLNSPYVLKIPYVNSSYATVTVPTTGVTGLGLSNCAGAANTTTDKTTCLFAMGDQVPANNWWPNYSSIAFDPSGNFYFVPTLNSTLTPGTPTIIFECNAACQTNSTANSATTLYTNANWISSIAFDSTGNLYFTDYVLDSTKTFFESSNLNELVYTSGKGYATSSLVLQSYTDTNPAANDEGITNVATDSKGNLYLGYANSGVYVIPNTTGTPDIAGEYGVSTLGALALTVDASDNPYVVSYNSTYANDGVARITVNTVTAPVSAVGTQVNPSAVTTILNDTTCSSSPSITFAANASSTATATASTTGTCSSMVTGAAAFATTVNFVPTVAGTDSVALTGTDQATNTGTVTITGVGSGFALSPSASTLSVVQGSSSTDTITVTEAGGFGGGVTLAASGLPSGVTASFDTNPTTGSSVLTLTATSTATTGGPVTVTITGTSGTLTETTTIVLTVNAPPSFTLAPSASSLSVSQGSTTSADNITIAPVNSFTGSVSFSASGLPSGVTATFDPNPATSNSTSLTLTATSTATAGGPVTVTITGTSGSLTETATVALTVNVAPSFSIAPATSSLTILQGASSSADTITVTPANGFTGSVSFAASGLPSGVTAVFSPNPTTSSSSAMTLTATSAATTGGPVTVTITGTSGSLSATSTIALTVNAPPSFTLSPAASTLTVIQSSNNTDTITVTPANGFTGSVTLSATGLPSGVTASFATNPATSSSVLTLTASSAATTGGPVTVTITGTSGSLSATSTIALTVNAPPSFTLSPAASTLTVVQGSNNTDTITVTPANGFTGSVTLSATGLPSGVTASFATNPATSSSVLTLTASSAATTGGPVTVTITGTSGSLSATTSIALTVSAVPGFTIGTGGTTSMTIEPGATTGNTGTISVVGTNGFSGTVNLSCNVTTAMTTVNDKPTCSLSPTSVSISGTTAETSTLTVTTTAATTAGNQMRKLFWPSAGGTAMALVLLFWAPRRCNWLVMLGLLVLSVAIGAVGCGGGSSSSKGNSGTTPGLYTITVTGTSGTASATVGTVAVTVQ